MRIKEAGVCRGSGKVFSKVVLASLPGKNAVGISASTTDGRDVPCSLYELDSTQTANRAFVAVVPMLDVPNCQITLTQSKENEAPSDSGIFRVNFPIAKWESRINYRLNQHLCREIRDYD